MRHSVRVASVGLTVLVSCFVLQGSFIQAAPKPKVEVTLSTSAIDCPLLPESAMHVCVSGLNPGDWASVPFPWTGTPQSHIFITFQGSADSTGSYCFDSPPQWA